MRKREKKIIEKINVEEVLAIYGDMVYRLALIQMKNRSEAEDIFQEVFLRLVRYQDRIRGEAHVKPWLIRVTVNCCRKQFGNVYRKRTVPLDREFGKEETYEMEDPENTVYEAVMNLPDDYRSTVHLFYYAQYSVKEIAGVLETSESAVKTRLSRARGMLRETLKGEYGSAGTTGLEKYF